MVWRNVDDPPHRGCRAGYSTYFNSAGSAGVCYRLLWGRRFWSTLHSVQYRYRWASCNAVVRVDTIWCAARYRHRIGLVVDRDYILCSSAMGGNDVNHLEDLTFDCVRRLSTWQTISNTPARCAQDRLSRRAPRARGLPAGGGRRAASRTARRHNVGT